MSLYNKYRPSNFNELFLSVPVENSIEDHHAFLFFGPSGTGKTSCARLLMSKFVNEGEIKQVISGKHPDYIEVNSAVNNGVDDIRNIIANSANTVPISSQYKFIIFDEAHMLTVQAQNALLKIVEEPPKKIKFIFCTTEIHKILPTIRTRCQKIPFLKLPKDALVNILKEICNKENFQYNIESLQAIADSADGSARNAINILEQYSDTLSEKDYIYKNLNVIGTQSFYELTKLICAKDKINSVKMFESMFEDSNDPGILVNKYGDFLAELIVLRIGDPQKCEFDGKQLMTISACVIDILKDFKILQNIKLISKINLLKTMEKL